MIKLWGGVSRLINFGVIKLNERVKKDIDELIENFVRVNITLVCQINKVGVGVKPDLLREVRENIITLNNIKHGRR